MGYNVRITDVYNRKEGVEYEMQGLGYDNLYMCNLLKAKYLTHHITDFAKGSNGYSLFKGRFGVMKALGHIYTY